MDTPIMINELPAPGKRVSCTLENYKNTQVYHSIYLPSNWSLEGSSPVIVEYTGNYYPPCGSSGEVKDANLGYGISGGKDYIWVVAPYISVNYEQNEITWWGDIEATVDYCIDVVSDVCNNYGGNKDKVLLCGFSRGSIGVNYIGLYNETISQLWCGFITHDHYDGLKEWSTKWGRPLSMYRQQAKERLKRIGNRPCLIMQNGSTKEIKDYLLAQQQILSRITFLDVPVNEIIPNIPNENVANEHTDLWMHYHSKYRMVVSQWLKSNLAY